MKTVYQLKQIDYEFKAMMNGHKAKMKMDGWLIKEEYELTDNDKYKYTVIYHK